MRTASLLIIVLLSCGVSWAQGPVPPVVSAGPTPPLADFARQERERRQAGTEASRRVITNEEAERIAPSIVVGRVGAVVPAAPAEPQPAPGGGDIVGVEIAESGPAIAQQQRVVRDLEDREVRLQLDINRFRGEYMAPVVSQRERDAALAGMNAAGSDLEAVRAQLEEARETLAALQQAAAETASNP